MWTIDCQLSGKDQHNTISLIFSSIYTVVQLPVSFIANILMSVVNLDLYVCEPGSGPSGLGGADSTIKVFNLKHKDYETAGLCTFMNLFQHVIKYSRVFVLTLTSFDGIEALLSWVAVYPACSRSTTSVHMHTCSDWTHSQLQAVTFPALCIMITSNKYAYYPILSLPI